ncbi:MAG: KEOPS complex kinase/ATPase Bud32, partial [Nanoarchaeota archaeon]
FMKIIGKGAESILYLKDGKLVKDRISKGYRHKEIDFMKRKYPTRREAKLLVDAAKFGINVPGLYKMDDKEMKVEMEFLKGNMLKDILDKSKQRIKLCKEVGRQVAVLHDAGIVHGDLTTSNMLLVKDKVYFIDFGLGFYSDKVEDKAVDLHLLRQALESKHFLHYEALFKAVLSGYKKSKNYSKVMTRFEKVEKRGRYKKKT